MTEQAHLIDWLEPYFDQRPVPAEKDFSVSGGVGGSGVQLVPFDLAGQASDRCPKCGLRLVDGQCPVHGTAIKASLLDAIDAELSRRGLSVVEKLDVQRGWEHVKEGKRTRKGKGSGVAGVERDGKRYGVGVGSDADGVFVHTHRLRSRSYPHLDAIPTKALIEVDASGAAEPDIAKYSDDQPRDYHGRWEAGYSTEFDHGDLKVQYDGQTVGHVRAGPGDTFVAHFRDQHVGFNSEHGAVQHIIADNMAASRLTDASMLPEAGDLLRHGGERANEPPARPGNAPAFFAAEPDIAKYSEDEPRDDHGRWTADGGDALGSAMTSPEGFSFNPYRGTQPATGYQVAMTGRSEFHDPAVLDDHQRLTEVLLAFREKNADVLTPGGRTYIGGWVSQGKLWLEPSERITSRAEAVQLAQQRNQIAIWDNARGQEIGTGGTGEGPDSGKAARPSDVPGQLGPVDRGAEAGSGRGHGGRVAAATGSGPLSPEVAKYSPDQPRDDNGRWTDGGGDSGWGKDWAPRSAIDTQHAFKNADGTYDPQRVATVWDPILSKMGDGVAPAIGQPTVYMTGGGFGSGKSTLLDRFPGLVGFPTDPTTAERVDPDAVKHGIPEYTALADPAHPDRSAATFVHEESSDISKQAVAEALGRNMNVVYDTSGDTDPDKLAAKVAGFRAEGAGRVVAAYAFPGSIEEAQARADYRAEHSGGLRRFVDPGILAANHREVASVWMASAKNAVYDNLTLWSTAGEISDPPTLVATAVGGKITVSNQQMFDVFKGMGK